MVVEVRDDDVALVVEANAPRRVEMLPQRSFEAVLVDENTFRGEQLDAMVPSV